MASNKKITMRQLQILIILSAMGTGVMVFPQRAAAFLPEGAQDGWLISIVIAILAVAVSVLISAAARALPYGEVSDSSENAGADVAAPSLSSENTAQAPSFSNENAAQAPSFINALAVLFSKPMAYVIGVVFWLKLVFSAGFELRIFLEICRDIMLPNTPMCVVGAVMLVTCGYAAAKGFETRARVAEVLFALILLPILFFFIIAVSDADFSNLKPIFVNDVGAVVYGAARLGFILTGLECLLLVSPYTGAQPLSSDCPMVGMSPRSLDTPQNYKRSLPRAVAGAVTVAGLLLVGITMLTIASFGRGVADQPYPVLNMMDVVNLPGSFIERQEAVVFGFWLVTAFAFVNALLFFGGLLACDACRRVRLRGGVIFTVLAVFCISCVPISKADVLKLADYMYMSAGIFFLVVLPLAILAMAKLSEKSVYK